VAGSNRVVVVIAGENQAQQVFNEINRGLGGLEKGSNTLKNALTGLAGAFAARELLQFAKGLIDVQDQAGKTAQKLGISTQFFTGLAYAAKLSDVESEALAKGLRFLSKDIDAAQVKGSEAAKVFQRLGISVKDANGALRPTQQVLLDVADRFSRMQDGATKTALALQLFGRTGSELIPMLNLGRAGIEELRAEAERLGLVIDDKTAAAAERLNDSMKRMEGAAQGAANQFLSGFIPAVDGAAEALSRAGTSGDTFRTAGERLGDWVRRAITEFIGLAFAARQLDFELAILNERAKGIATLGILGADKGKLAQYRLEVQLLNDDFRAFTTTMQNLSRTPSFNDLFDPSKNIGNTLRSLGVNTRTAAPPLPSPAAGGGEGKGWDLATLQKIAAMVPDIDLVFNQMVVDANAAAAAMAHMGDSSKDFLSTFSTPLPRGWPDELKDMETQIDLIFSKLRTDTEEVQGLVARGAISEIEGGQKIVDLHRATGAELAALIPKYRELAALTGDPKLGAGVEELAARVKNLQNETNVLGNHIREVFVDDFANAVANIATGTESIADAFKNMAKSVIGELVRIIAKMLIIWLLSKLLGGIFGIGGGGGLSLGQSLASVFGGKAQGGHYSAGEPFIAGEMGMPELIVPETAGTVISGQRFASMRAGGEGDVYIDARGADIGVEQRIRRLEHGQLQMVGASMRAMYEYDRRS